MSKLHLFRKTQETFELTPLAVDAIVSGTPSASTLNIFQTSNDKVFSGIWRVTPGAWRVVYDECEYCYIIKGRARIEETGGRAFEISAGDAFVLDAGFEGTWHVLEDLEKHYMIVLP